MSATYENSFRNGFADPSTAQDTFAQQFDLQNPEDAMTSYQKIMHQHTKQQFDMAAASSRRHSANSDGSMSTLSTETSNNSMSSTAS